MLKKFRRTYRTLNTVFVSQEALRNNYNLYKTLLPGIHVCPVLKSNAYGHGIQEVAKIISKENPSFLVVDSLYEAYEIEKTKVKIPILVMGYTHPENLLKKKLPFHFTACDLETAAVLAKMKVGTHIEIDTGMRRMGFSMDELANALKSMKKMDLKLVGVFTHLADADNADTSYTDSQCKKFQQALAMIHEAGFNPEWIHVGNSAGSLKTKMPELNMIRLGISLYGISPLDETDSDIKNMENLKPALTLESTLIATRSLKRGDKVSYGCTFEAPHDMKIGVIPFGYYEGMPRDLSNKGCVVIARKICPIVGRVCMNHTMIDLTKSTAKIGDTVIVYGGDRSKPNSFYQLAKKSGTISYELMVRLAASIRRIVL